MSEKKKTSKNKENKEISYKNYEFLSRFVSDRARMYDRKQTGFTAKTQRKLSREIKRARHLGLLPFKASV